MEEKLCQEFWETMCGGMKTGAASGLHDYFPKLKASLKALDLTSAYWSWSASSSYIHVLLCGARGFGQIQFTMKGITPRDKTWNHTIHLSVLPWSEVTGFTQNFIREGPSRREDELVLRTAELCLRSVDPISLLPAQDMDNSGGVRVVENKVEPFTDLTVFIGAVIAAQH